MPDVDLHFPYDRNLSKEAFLALRLPEKLRGLDDRRVAQIIFDTWLHENPSFVARYQANPPHWTDR